MCECCQNARIGPAYATHDPACLHCGARLIWRIQRFQIPRQEKIERCRRAMKFWADYGHSEAELRKLAKLDEMPVAPELSTGRGKRGGVTC